MNFKIYDIITMHGMWLDMDKIILLLDDSVEGTSGDYLSKLISMGIYNFTTNLNGVKYLKSSLKNINYNYSELEDLYYYNTNVLTSKCYTSTMKDVDINFRDFEGSEFSNLQILDVVINQGIDIKE